MALGGDTYHSLQDGHPPTPPSLPPEQQSQRTSLRHQSVAQTTCVHVDLSFTVDWDSNMDHRYHMAPTGITDHNGSSKRSNPERESFLISLLRVRGFPFWEAGLGAESAST